MNDLRLEITTATLLSGRELKSTVHLQPFTRDDLSGRWKKRGPGFVADSAAEHLRTIADMLDDGRLDVLLDPKAHAESTP